MFLLLWEVPGLQPKMVIEPSPPSTPRMLRWGVLFFRLGSGVGACFYDDTFFSWWDRQDFAIDDYCFSDVDFWNDPELVLPPDAQWGWIGKTSKFLYIHVFWRFYNIFICVWKWCLNIKCLLYADCGTPHPVGLPRVWRRGRDRNAEDMQRALQKVQRNLEHLCAGVPVTPLEDLLVPL